MANRTIHRPARPLSKKHQAALKHQRNGARRRLWLIALKIWPAFLVLAIAAVLIYAYRGAQTRNTGPVSDMVSQTAPDFVLPTLDGAEISLADFRGKKNVLLFFNEGYGCDPCWQQALKLQEDMDKFAAMDTEVFAVMVDPADVLRKEASRWGLTELPILVDESTKVSKSYNALGGMHADKPNHTFILISREGLLVWDADYPSMRANPEAVIQQVRDLVER